MKPSSRLILMAVPFALTLFLGFARTVAAHDSGSVVKSPFGTTSLGTPIDEYTLTNVKGLEVKIITYGGIITSMRNRKLQMPNIVLGFNSLNDYETLNSPGPHFGAIIGRYANRIANGVFTLDGVTYSLDANNGVNSLHGGFKGFDTKVWTVTGVIDGSSGVGIEPHYLSPAGDGWTDIEPYYMRVDGTGSFAANQFTPVNNVQIPTGTTPSVIGTVFDFLKPKLVSQDIRFHSQQLSYGNGNGFDHNGIVNRPRGYEQLNLAAIVREPNSGRTLNVWTDQPGIQLYTGNSLDGSLYGTSNREYRQSDGLALESQHYPDSPNHPSFPSTTLSPGQTYETTTIFEIGN